MVITVLFIVGFHLEFLSVRLTFDYDLVARVSNPVKDSVGNHGIGKESRPIRHRSVGSEDNALGSEASVDNGIEPLCRCLINGFKAEVINDKQIDDQKPFDHHREFVLEISSCKLGEEFPEAVEGDREHHAAGLVGQSLRQMSFACAGRTKEEDAFSPLNETATGKITDKFSVDRWIERHVK